jgi:RNA polymerase sigma-70 factor, ECF subfamily
MEDKLLILRFKWGSTEALRRIYEKYEGNMLTVAAGLLNSRDAAEDVVHDVFVSLAQSPEKLKLAGSLRSYLTTCVANLAKDRLRARRRRAQSIAACEEPGEDSGTPFAELMQDEALRHLAAALAQLPEEQREIVVMHVTGGMTFREIADARSISINTALSRYRYGIDKLRSMLNGEVDP